jgi:hypothetical protein
MDELNILIVVSVSISGFALIVIFSNLHNNSHDEKPQNMIAHIPVILEENDKEVEQKNLRNTDKIQINPIDAILEATKTVSAQPSDLRSITLEMENGYPVYSMDIFNSWGSNSVEVTVDAVYGKAVRTSQDLDDNSNKLKKDVPKDFNG